MSLATFPAGTFIMSLSGVLAPGPLIAVTPGKKNRSPLAGLFIAQGHGVVELPLMAAVAAGLGYLS